MSDTSTQGTTMADFLRMRALYWLALGFALFQLFVPVLVQLFDMQLRALHVMLGVCVALTAFAVVGRARGWLWLVLDVGLMVVVIVANVLIYLNWEDIITYPGGATRIDLLLGGALILILLEAARRTAGWAIPICVALMFAYVFLGSMLPGMWTHPGFPLDYVVGNLYHSTSGIYGSLTGTSATFIAMFIIFGSLLQVTGGGKTFMDLALVIAGRYRGGPAKVGVVASAMFGMISGSAVANVSVTGNYTIPLMRRLGYPPNFAGGVEAMSSTGGGITPPIMGITAFIMADFLNISYVSIIGYAAIPCILFYTGILSGVHFEAARLGLASMPEEEIPTARSVLTWPRLVPLLVPIFVLLGLLFQGYTLMSSGFYACMAVIVLYLLRDLSPSAMLKRAKELVDALADGGKAVALIVPILVCVAMFTSLLGLTGVAPKLSGLILEFGAGNLVVALMLAAIIPLVLGAPLPVTATYILCAALIAPALVKLGIDVVAAHMFLLYWATLASVTPPTCTACVVAANIAGGNWFKTSIVGMKLGFVAFLIPFFFVINPALIARGPIADVIFHGFSALVGTVFLAAGFFGYMRSRLGIPIRGIYLVTGILLLVPDNTLLVIGILLGAAGLAIEFAIMRVRRVSEKSSGQHQPLSGES